MPRYIDAYKLYSRLIDAKHLFCKNQLEFRALPPNDKARADEIDNLISIVINFPTADVVKRERGKWEVCGTFDDFLKCSCCGYRKPWNEEVFNFCPSCGAEMEKADEQEIH